MVSAVLLSVNGYGVANYVVPRGLTPGALYRNLDTGVVYPADASWMLDSPCRWGSTRMLR